MRVTHLFKSAHYKKRAGKREREKKLCARENTNLLKNLVATDNTTGSANHNARLDSSIRHHCLFE